MKVAIVGANFLGCSTAYYLRRALNSNRQERNQKENLNNNVDAAVGKDCDIESTDEVTVFDNLPRTGGHKFNTLSLGQVSACVGTAASLDISSGQPLQSLLCDISFSHPHAPSQSQWSIYDWDADCYYLSKHRSKLLSSISSNLFIVSLIQIVALCSSWHFGMNLLNKGLGFFLGVKIDEDFGKVAVVRYHYVIWFCFTLYLAGGIIPIRTLFKFHNYLIQFFGVRILSSIQYGIPSISNSYDLTRNFREHLKLMDKHDSGTSCITLGHLLSACGLAKYAKKSTSEFLGRFHISENFLNQCVWPSMSLSYGGIAASISQSNSLATMLALSSTAPVPSSLRSNAKYLSVDGTKTLCSTLLDSANANLRLNTQIVSVMKNGADKYDLYSKNDGDDNQKVGTFDAVLIAAVINPAEFTSDALDGDVNHIFSLNTSNQAFGDSHASSTLNKSKFVSLIRGELKPTFFKLNSADDMLDQTYILNSINTSEVTKVSADVWRVTSSEAATKGSSVCESIFKSVSESVTYERPSQRYSLLPLTNLHEDSAPNIILGKKFVNVAAIDRVCNDVNMECISARNAASLFRDNVVEWK